MSTGDELPLLMDIPPRLVAPSVTETNLKSFKRLDIATRIFCNAPRYKLQKLMTKLQLQLSYD